MSEPIVFKLPIPPNLANGRGHSRWSGAQKKRYFERLDRRQGYGLIPPPPKEPFAKAELHAVLELGAAMDDDNAKLRAYKWPCDWLKTRGYIVDDRKTRLTMHDPEQSVKRREEYHVHLTLTPTLP